MPSAFFGNDSSSIVTFVSLTSSQHTGVQGCHEAGDRLQAFNNFQDTCHEKLRAGHCTGEADSKDLVFVRYHASIAAMMHKLQARSSQAT